MEQEILMDNNMPSSEKPAGLREPPNKRGYIIPVMIIGVAVILILGSGR
jgi:hypothetical protein